jgi:hypothetical protein
MMNSPRTFRVLRGLNATANFLILAQMRHRPANGHNRNMGEHRVMSSFLDDGVRSLGGSRK